MTPRGNSRPSLIDPSIRKTRQISPSDCNSSLDEEREKLEVELAGRTEAFRKLWQAKQMTPGELQKSLPEGTVLVDFSVYRKQDRRKREWRA